MIRIIKKIFACAICVTYLSILTGCANNFAKFYRDGFANAPGGRPEIVEFYSGQPKLIQGGNPQEDTTRMIENGYVRVGVSSFNSGRGPADDAISVARDNGAEFVIYYSKYTHTVSGNIPYTVQNPNQTITSQGSGNIYGYGGSATYNSTTTTTVPGGSTTYDIPYSVDRRDYLATYWSKNNRILFGTLVKDLPNDIKRQLERNRGAIVDIVVKNSPAFNADVLKGDILTKIDDQEIYDAKDFMNKIKTKSGKKVVLEIIRNGNLKVIQVGLN